MRVLVLGGSGMLGHKVVQRLADTTDLWFTLRGSRGDPTHEPVPELVTDRAIPNVDVMTPGTVERLVREVRPDVVVNCVGLTKHRDEGLRAVPAISVNALLPHLLIALLAEWGGRLVHVSTDCVFSGARGDYTEDDATDATDLYGRTKALGEVVTGHAVTIRTSIIGRELRDHGSLLEWLLRQRGRTIRGYRHAMWSGVTTLHLAEVIETVIRQHPGLTGLYHLSSGRISKLALLEMLRTEYHLNVDIVPDNDFRLDRSLVGARFEQATGYQPPAMGAMLRALAQDPTPYRMPE